MTRYKITRAMSQILPWHESQRILALQTISAAESVRDVRRPTPDQGFRIHLRLLPTKREEPISPSFQSGFTPETQLPFLRTELDNSLAVVVGCTRFATASSASEGEVNIHATRRLQCNADGKQALKSKDYARAEKTFRQAIQLAEAIHVEDDLLARSLRGLAKTLQACGKLNEAESLYQRALQLHEKLAQSDSISVVAALCDLASLYVTQEKYLAAEQLFMRSLAILENYPEKNVAWLAYILNGLGRTYLSRGKYSEAESFFRRNLQAEEQFRGRDSLDVANALHWLVHSILGQEEYAEAEPLLKRVMSIREPLLGADHPEVVAIASALARTYYDLRQLSNARSLYQQLIPSCERALGEDHIDVADLLIDLANLLIAQCQPADAEPLYERALAIYERQRGPDDLSVAECLVCLGNSYYSRGKFEEAERLFKTGLVIRMQKLGADHRDVADSMFRLAILQSDQGRYSDAERLFLGALAIEEKVLGTDHRSVAVTLNGLRWLYVRMQRFEDAHLAQQRVIRIYEATRERPSERRQRAYALRAMATLLEIRGATKDALELEARARNKLREEPRSGDSSEALRLMKLGHTAFDSGDLIRAESLYLAAITIYEQALGPDDRCVAESWSHFARAIVRQGRHAEAAVYLRRVERSARP